jgi:alginate O-acetyltransferase complex protein AlgJ
MMQKILYLARFLLPALFLSYAAYANLSMLTGGRSILPDHSGAVLKGELTAGIDGLYREQLPHTDPSIGLIGALRYVTLGEGRSGVVAGSGGWLFTGEELRSFEGPGSLDDSIAHISRVKDELAKDGTHLVMVPLPAKIDVYRDHAEGEAPEIIAATYEAMIEKLKAVGIDTVDVRGALIAGRATIPTFLRTDTHWTTDGADIVAREIAASGLVPVGEQSFVAEPDPERKFYGDLVSFVTSDNLAPLVGLGPEHQTPYLAEGTGGDLTDLFGTGGVDTVLVGTSYSANPTWSFIEALKLSLGRDVLNASEEGRGPGQPMLAYLDSELRKNAPAKTVIWEFPVRYLTDPDLWPDEGNV